MQIKVQAIHRMWIQRLNVFNKTELYNPSQYENQTKDIADHVKINKKIGAKNKIIVRLKIAMKNQCLWNVGVGSLWDNEKCELAANNGDTLVEAVISAERNKFRLG